MHNFIQTYSGRRVTPLDPDPAQIDLIDIAKALSQLCRFCGHTQRFYSVAEHSLHVQAYVEGRLAGDAAWRPHLAHLRVEEQRRIQRIVAALALLHDASEAYLTDLPTPIKHSNAPWADAYRDAEAAMQYAVEFRFGLHVAQARHLTADQQDLARVTIHQADRAVLLAERVALMGGERAGAWGIPAVTPAFGARFVVGHDPAKAEALFLNAARNLELDLVPPPEGGR